MAPTDESLRLMPYQHYPTADTPSPIQQYLAGTDVPKEWFVALSARRSADQPPVLYRLAVMDASMSTVGARIRNKRLIMSASDTKRSAIVAGCMFASTSRRNLEGKALALIEIKNPVVCLSLKELMGITASNKDAFRSSSTILYFEREYLIRGPALGTIIDVLTADVVTNKRYIRLMEKMKHEQTTS